MRPGHSPRAPRGVGWLAALALIGPGALARAQDLPPELVARTEARTPEAERAAFRLPPGFEAQLIVAEPDIAKPMNLAFDDRGRLWVTVSREYPYPAEEGAPRRDRVVILDDFGPNGRARKITTFADDLNIPIGVLPLGDGRRALVHSIPNVYLMTDDDGDGKADRREIAYSTFGFRDTHGMASAFTMGFDGWVYACHGFANSSEVKGSDDQTVTMNSGNTYRLRPDGSHIEQLTWGQVNPFGLAFDPLGNLYSCDCHSRPIYQLLRGAYYPSFGKPDDGLGYGPEMMQHDHGSTGIAGITVYEADAWPESYRGQVFIGNVVTARINRDRIERTGTSPKAVPLDDFLASDDPWFRPVDIELGPDGNLYVADFYNRIIGHYEVPLTHPGRDRDRGRIWRIVYKGTDARPTPAPHGGDFTRATDAELIDALGHPNLAVRLRATHMLAERPDALEAVRRAVAQPANPATWVHGLWVLYRRGAADPATCSAAAGAADAIVRTHAQKVLGELEGWNGALRDLALQGLQDAEPTVRRAAAEAIGGHPSVENLRPLLDARHAADPRDTHLVHVVRMALRNQLSDPAAFPKVTADDHLDARDLATLADVANGVTGVSSAQFLLGYLTRFKPTGVEFVRQVEHVARQGNAETDQALVTLARSQTESDRGRAFAAINAIHRGWQGRGAAMPAEATAWAITLATTLLDSGDPGLCEAGVELAGSFRLGTLRDRLADLARAVDAPEPRRLKAIQALNSIDPAIAVGVLGTLMADAAQPMTLREQAATLLGQSGRPDARDALRLALPSAPARLQGPIAVSLAADQPGALTLLDLIAKGTASPRLLQQKPVELRLRQANVPDLEARLSTLLAGIPAADAAMQELIGKRQSAFARSRGEASAERGAAVYAKNCGACHQLGGQGGRVGPQLDGIGARGPDRLMEDILDPNRNVDQAFRATSLALRDGRLLSGLVLSDEGEVVILADAKGQEVRVPKESIEERQVAPLSPMPANFSEQITEAEFRDLIAYLLDRREAPAPR